MAKKGSKKQAGVVDSAELEDRAWDIYSQVEQVEDVLDRVKMQTHMIAVYRDIVKQFSDDRREDVAYLNRTVGLSYGELADELQMTRGRIQQLVTGISGPKRPGVIELDARIAMAEMEATGAPMSDIVKALVPRIREHRGGQKLSADQIAKMLGVDEETVKREMLSA